jgi:hypothetical protein
VVGEVFSTAEVDDGTANPLRLNSEGRMRWLCERTLQSARNDGELRQTVAQQEDKMEKRLERTKEMIEERLELTEDMMEKRMERTDAKVDSIGAQVEEMRSMIAQLVALQAGGAAAPARVAHYALGD